MKCSSSKSFTPRQETAILRLYVRQQLTGLATSKRLQLSAGRVFQFLHERRLLRHRGYHLQKLGAAEYRQLEKELLTTTDIVLARRYGLSRERVRQIRQGLGYPSSRVLRRGLALRARIERRKKEQLARQRVRTLRQRQHEAVRLPAIDRLSQLWKSGRPISELAQEYGISPGAFGARIVHVRKLYPEKFPYRIQRRSPRLR